MSFVPTKYLKYANKILKEILECENAKRKYATGNLAVFFG